MTNFLSVSNQWPNSNSDNNNGMLDALSSLTGGQNVPDLGNLVEKAKQAGMGAEVSSWLGDGENSPVSSEQIKVLFGEDRLAEAATRVGIDSNTVALRLSVTVPNLIDTASTGGSITEYLTSVNGTLHTTKRRIR